jgi:hypothetical protein
MSTSNAVPQCPIKVCEGEAPDAVSGIRCYVGRVDCANWSSHFESASECWPTRDAMARGAITEFRQIRAAIDQIGIAIGRE